MKKILYFLFIMFISMTASNVFATNVISGVVEVNVSEDNYLTEEEAELLTMRIEEIREMDKSILTAEEKLELRTELKDIRKDLKRQGGYIYVSVGTVLIVLLLILLLR
jgi:hypothetical protein